jgi:hypothetical protein
VRGTAGRHLRRRLTCAGLAIGVGAIAPGPAAAAVEPIELPGVTLASVAADLDGDGEREVVRLVDAAPGTTAIDAWRESGDGWVELGTTPLVTPDELGNDTLADRSLGTAALLRTRLAGRDRLVALTAQGIPGDTYGRTCCLALAEVRVEPSGDIGLSPIRADGLDRGANVVHAIDLDGDGTDELVTGTTDFREDGAPVVSRVVVLSWSADRFTPIGEGEGLADYYGHWVGETDGQRGDDLILGVSQFGDLVRVTMAGGAPSFEAGHVDLGEPFEGWVLGIADGSIVLTARNGLSVVRWPHGGRPAEVAHLDTETYPATSLVGTGPDALIIHHDNPAYAVGDAPTADVYDLGLEQLVDDLPGAASTDEIWHVLNEAAGSRVTGNRNAYPYVGPMPDVAPGGRAGYANSGILIAQDGAGGYETHPTTAMAGLYPMGVAGRDDAWLMVGDGVIYGPSGSSAYIFSGALGPFGRGRLLMLPAEWVLAPDEAGRQVSVELRGPVVDVDDPNGPRLLSGPGGFEVLVTAPPGTVVLRGYRGYEEYEVADGPINLAIAPANARAEENRPFEVWVVALTPDGQVEARHWSGTFVREFPELAAEAATETFGLAATVRGTASPGTVVAVDGRPVPVAADGAFDIRIDAAPWPEDVLVVARDPLGNETTMRLQVVGFLDYRGLPWLPIVGLATVAAGVVVFIRVPGRRPEPMTAWAGDGRLEEIDAD